MRIALCQFDPLVGALEENARAMVKWSVLAKSQGAELCVFPELSLCGYPPRDLALEPWFVRANTNALQELARELALPSLVGHLKLAQAQAPFGRPIAHNTASLLQDGAVAGSSDKILLPTYDVFDEARVFVPGTEVHPLRFGSHRLGVTVCEDMWGGVPAGEAGRYPRDPVQELVDGGATLLLNLSASPYALGHTTRRLEVLRQTAMGSGLPVFQTNLAGATDSLIFDGASCAVAPNGALLGLAASFQPECRVLSLDSSPVSQGLPGEDPMDSVMEALTLGIGSYARKCGFQRALLGLSGGIDSAVVAALAVRAMGADGVRGLTLPGPYSSEGSWGDSELLAQRLGMELLHLDINPVYGQLLTSLEPLLGELGSNVTAQNLQARARGVFLMALSNHDGDLLLATGNKSELAVGYATLYGDMAGGLAPIGDLYKTRVQALALSLNRAMGDPIPDAILTKAPSAELAPEQQDTDSLPPYPMLDAVVEALVEGGLGVEEICQEELAPRAVVERIARMLQRAEYKRYQAPPVLRVTPRLWQLGRRMSIAATLPTSSS